MYCNQCGCEIKETAKFCKKCGAPVEEELKQPSELQRSIIRIIHTKRKALLIGLIAVFVITGAAVAAISIWHDKAEPEPEAAPLEVVSVDLKDEYEMEDNELILDPLTATYSDGTVGEISGYKVYIDSFEYTMEDGKINGSELYDGKHLIRLEWKAGGSNCTYEKTVGIKHKIDTWAKYPYIVGKSGKEISAAYGSLSSPEFGGLSEGDWGYAYVYLSARNLTLKFPAGIFDNPEDYGESDAGCISMAGTLSDLFYNMETEMTQSRLSEILDVTLSEHPDGGCSGVLASGHYIYIGVGEVTDGLYFPTTVVKVHANEEQEGEIFDYFF